MKLFVRTGGTGKILWTCFMQEVSPLCDKVELYDNTEQFVKIISIKNGRSVYKAEKLPDWAKDICIDT